MDKPLLVIKPLGPVGLSLSWSVPLGAVGVSIFIMAPLVLKPVVVLGFAGVLAAYARRSLQITFEITDEGVHAANFYRECTASWSEIECIDGRGWIHTGLSRLPTLRLLLRQNEQSYKKFAVQAGIMMGKNKVQLIDELRRHAKAHGVPVNVNPKHVSI